MTDALDDEDMSASDVSSASSKASSGAQSDGVERPIRILLVEDDFLTQKIVTRLLSSLHFEGKPWTLLIYCTCRLGALYAQN